MMDLGIVVFFLCLLILGGSLIAIAFRHPKAKWTAAASGIGLAASIILFTRADIARENQDARDRGFVSALDRRDAEKEGVSDAGLGDRKRQREALRAKAATPAPVAHAAHVGNCDVDGSEALLRASMPIFCREAGKWIGATYNIVVKEWIWLRLDFKSKKAIANSVVCYITNDPSWSDSNAFYYYLVSLNFLSDTSHKKLDEFSQGAFKDAIGRSDEVANPPAKEPPASEAAYRRGLSSLNNGDYDQAIKELSNAIETDPSDIFPYIERAIAYEKKGNREGALADYRAARAITNDATTRKNMDAAIRRLGAGTRPKIDGPVRPAGNR